MKALELAIPPLIVVIVIAVLMWLSRTLAPELSYEFNGRRILGILLAVAGAAVAAAGVVQFRRSRTTVDPRAPAKATSLVVGGIYRFTRNPMYLGFALGLLGWAVLLGNALSLLGPVGLVAYLDRFQIRPEERALSQRFPEEFDGYVRRVRRWI